MREFRFDADGNALPKPRRIRVPLEDGDGDPAILKATLIRTFGDVIEMHLVAGCRFYQPALARLAVHRPRAGFPCVLIREIANPHDERAIAVWTRGGRCGYIPRSENRAILPLLVALEEQHGTPIAIPGDLVAAPYGLMLAIELPEDLRGPR